MVVVLGTNFSLTYGNEFSFSGSFGYRDLKFLVMSLLSLTFRLFRNSIGRRTAMSGINYFLKVLVHFSFHKIN